MRRGSLEEVCAVDLYFFFFNSISSLESCVLIVWCVIEAEASEPIWSKSTKQSAYLGHPKLPRD